MIAFHLGLYGFCSCLFGRDVFSLLCFICACVLLFWDSGIACCCCCSGGGLLRFACGVVCLSLFYYYAVLLLVF